MITKYIFLFAYICSVATLRLQIPTNKSAEPKVLFIVRTHHKNYDTKLKAVMDTWGAPLGNSLILVGDKPWNKLSVPVHGAPCVGDHSVGLSCRNSFALRLAEQSDADWVFIADDDLYVRTSSVKRQLAKQNASQLFVWGIKECGWGMCEDGQGGMCGGGGYALSRAGWESMLHGNPNISFEEELKNATSDTNLTAGLDDIAISCVMRRHKVYLRNMKGLYGWRLKNYTNAIQSTNPIPLTFHYMHPEEMRAVHKQFLQFDAINASHKALHNISVHGDNDYMAQRDRYITNMNKQFRRIHAESQLQFRKVHAVNQLQFWKILPYSENNV